MKRFVVMLAVVAVLMVALAAPAFAFAYNPNGLANGKGQGIALEKCGNAVNKQQSKGVSAGGGPKEGLEGPSNCDHYYQLEGFIGN